MQIDFVTHKKKIRFAVCSEYYIYIFFKYKYTGYHII